LGWFFDFVITSGSGFLKTCFQRTDGFYKRTREIPSRFFDQFFNFVSITIYRSKAVIWSRVTPPLPTGFFLFEKGKNHPTLVFF
jgi:hypothetical protein